MNKLSKNEMCKILDTINQCIDKLCDNDFYHRDKTNLNTQLTEIETTLNELTDDTIGMDFYNDYLENKQ